MRRLRNSTPVPDALLREIEAVVMPPGGVPSYDLEVRRSHAHAVIHARCYPSGSGYHETARPFIVLRIGQRQMQPRWPKAPSAPRRPGYLPEPWFASQVEEIVYVFAHELRHLWQSRVPRGRRVWGARGQYSERDADAYALRALRAWRRRPVS